MYSSSPSIGASSPSLILASPLFLSFLDTQNLLMSSLGLKGPRICQQLSCPLVYLLNFFPCPPQELSCVSYKEDNRGFYPQNEIPVTQFGSKKLSRSSEIIFCYFSFHLRLFDDVHFHYSQVLVNFIFFERSDSFWISIPSVIYVFLILIMCMVHFSLPTTWPGL